MSSAQLHYNNRNRERHQRIHLSNPNINYVQSESCRYCISERRRNYSANLDRTRINLRAENNQDDHITSYIHVTDQESLRLLRLRRRNALININNDDNNFDPSQFNFEDVKIWTSLKDINNFSKIKINTIAKHKSVNNSQVEGEDQAEPLECCVICQEPYEGTEVIRSLGCGHEYHIDCIDTWLESNQKCPLCKIDIRNEINNTNVRRIRRTVV